MNQIDHANSVIELSIYDQEGTICRFAVKDTPSNRHLTEWLRRFDRYEGVGERKVNK